MHVKNFNIGSKQIGGDNPVYIIAEAGSNHNGSIDNAKTLIDIAHEAGADAIKFQSFQAKQISAGYYPAYEVFRRNELRRDWHKELFEYAKNSGLDFLSTPFDIETADFLKDLGVPAFKIASGDITYIQLLRHLGQYDLPVILSTGKSTLGEIETALLALSTKNVVLLHCIASYPASYEEMNLKSIKSMKNAFPGYLVGLSDHTLDSICALGSLPLGSSVLEKHITFDNSAEGPDHQFAMEKQEFKDYVNSVRSLEAAMGDGIKKPSLKEKETIERGRRSIHAAARITKGTVLTGEHLKIVRPGGGISPSNMPALIGKTAAVDIEEDDMIKWHFLN